MRGNEGSSKRKLVTYKTFGKNVEFKECLHGVSDEGTRLLQCSPRRESGG